MRVAAVSCVAAMEGAAVDVGVAVGVAVSFWLLSGVGDVDGRARSRALSVERRPMASGDGCRVEADLGTSRLTLLCSDGICLRRSSDRRGPTELDGDGGSCPDT